jgi:hypothetical protein
MLAVLVRQQMRNSPGCEDGQHKARPKDSCHHLSPDIAGYHYSRPDRYK